MEHSERISPIAPTSVKRLLFIPVSSTEGIGEYIRSLTLALSLKQRYADAIDVHFALNQHTKYASTCPFNTTLLAQSPTKENTRVCALIQDYKPDVVIFDCAGRASQMRSARAAGAQVVFISQHAKKRAKGLKLNRVDCIDKHWVVQPDFCIEPLSWLERLKIRCFNLVEPINIGPYFALPDAQSTRQAMADRGVQAGQYVVVNAGSGGHLSEQGVCADVFYKAAQELSERLNIPTVVVFGANYPDALPVSSDPLVHVVGGLSNAEFIALLANAKMGLLSAGDALLQAIALQLPCVAAPVSKDQPKRLAMCSAQGLVHAAPLNRNTLTAQAVALLNDEQQWASIQNALQGRAQLHSQDFIAKQFQELLAL
ncbi:glycosyltransferase family 1 protein [Pseudoalteromonas sp. Cnat2-41]|uniref:glycosyltransferase family 1 protein n=1 Tax=unclassified Pseudoalteromonas TaxID=194690 RepID=UPI001EF8B887|nr:MULTISPECIES: glycosyltransferase family 1 protein [unclassified Pseudoalteromonas]MCF2862223.1 glycosyltransferase family 1 protein [Pseudoalteromonas sp. CNAT2-18]MCG7558008.1 glycosyltransferase family 1 protein [Pseudoalteromonas sp. CNAT2-18.1]MCG7566332.1 glycosyltransferase family 1 protein [Pseudoalteromonas sp. CnMc7-15]MCG7570046.1 glycosyltransferase family 1 protein [Pseudoalteromonas sp. CNC9-20]